MKRWLVILVLCVGCGSSNPVTPAPEDDLPAEMTFAHVSVTELEAYLAGVSDVFTSIDVFFTEYGGITAEAAGGLMLEATRIRTAWRQTRHCLMS